MFSSCELKPSRVEGEYYSDEIGAKYILTLSKNKFTQTLIEGNDTFKNEGVYHNNANIVSVTFWKERSELIDTVNHGGCAGCELKYNDGKLFFYTDPDGSPKETFVKQ